MKHFLLSAASALILLAASACSNFSNRGEVERPMIGSANTPSLSFEKVELTDSSTVLHSVVNFGPGMWVRIAPSSAIQVDGVSYPLSSIEGIAAGEQVVMPDSGVIRFTMTFPAIPENAKSLNFSEGVDNGWAIWNVDLTGKAAHNQNSSLVPKAALKNKPSIPEEMMAYGDTTVINFHILGYKPEMGNRLSWAANTLHGQIGLDLPEAEVDAEGNAVVKLMLSAPADMMPIRLNSGVNIGGTFFVAPGETVNAYLDTHMSGIWNMEVRDGEAMIAPDADYQQVYTDGIYPILRRELSMQLYSGEFGDYHMNGDEYTAYILDIHKSLSDSIDACQGMSDANRRYNKAWLDGELIVATTAAKLWLERNYYHQYGWNSQIPADSINCQLSPENIKAIAAQIDFNNPLLLLTGDLEHNTKVEMWEQAGVDAGVLKTLENYVSAYDAADNGALDEQALAGMNLPAPMAEEIKTLNAEKKAELEALNSAALVTPTPDVAPDKVFDAIVAPHKGKVVVVDLWNTWCGPCRAAIKDNEPAKSGDLASDDIVWIYIANQTSPRAKYLQMISDIKGIHYQLDDAQWRAICDRFKVDGIPYYIIVDRNGKAEGRPDIRDHSLYKKTILEKLAR